MDYLDTAIVLTLVIITVAEFSALTTDKLMSMIGSRTRGYDYWCECVVEEVRLSLIHDVDFTAAQSAHVLEKLNILMAYEREKAKPYLNRSVLLNNILSTASKVSAPKMADKLAQVLPDRIAKCDHSATSRFRLRTGVKVACVATIIALALNISSLSLINELENTDADDLIRLQSQIESLNTRLEAEDDPTNAGAIMIELRSRLNQRSDLESKTFSVGPIAPGINRMSIEWIFGCVLTGLLAGLGAPFWRQQLSRLMTLKDLKEQVSVDKSVGLNDSEVPENQWGDASVGDASLNESAIKDSAINVPSGVTGKFIPTNISWDPLSNQIDLDVIAQGKPERVYMPEELVHTLRLRLAPQYNANLAAVNIRPESLKKLANSFFSSN
ncbi:MULTISPECIES: hypothetical protein [Alteromonas]|uniref:Uncharacterized protein n=1 Tax=Alteromonas stellipolaris TaxID=233316 RepID=A0AAW7Z5D7_9ALTE|nr:MULTISPECIES: hypothetical protein [Alteromonas]AMJ91860.1 hypothetical protein AV940_16035 [Alteromonas sp. Mac2]ALM89282.1 hypothetical protein AOR13_227 [Alteromonas stellipolaris LMG 21856]AMJ75573.1 hypothetical protein AVL57_17345 [Alteromonas stellipolaris]AMJ87997.1 hypothetical protein AV939_16285 [Alteromonas sp. Mac1]ANB21291.1 hypothetical protein A6K25_08395 [Alteromonas stellipolaris]